MTDNLDKERSVVNNKRIARNTLLLYVRMLFLLLVSLFTSRVLLQILGITDYGVYNIVGGIVVLFSFLSNAMTGSTQRYLNYNIGLNKENEIRKIFSVCMQAHFLVAILVFILAETIGLWFVDTQLNVPVDRKFATHVVYQFSIFTTCVNIVKIPYNAAIVAYEKMSFFAFVSVIEAILKLLIVYLLLIGNVDKLVVYSFYLFAISLIIWYVYRYYCRSHYSVCVYTTIKSPLLLKELFGFTSWYLLGGASVVGAKQGVAVLLNIFYGVTVNAAVGISNQVNNAIYGFVTNFQTAFNPQIVKLYANNEQTELFKLIFRATKFSFILLFVLSFPVIVNCNKVLSFWLVDVPEYAVSFTILTIVISIFDTISAPLWTVIGAIGKVKKYQLTVSFIILFSMPISYVLLYNSYSPISVFYVNIIINFFAFLYRLLYSYKYLRFNLLKYFTDAILPCLLIVVVSCTFLIILDKNLNWMLSVFLIVSVTSVISYFLGLSHGERQYVNSLIKQKIFNRWI